MTRARDFGLEINAQARSVHIRIGGMHLGSGACRVQTGTGNAGVGIQHAHEHIIGLDCNLKFKAAGT